ncbi:RidA family protein [Rhodococcus sp. IEGM 1307]|jgi:enamine deaminase RidA (YjgF/YER057c/UK114 family)|uniref:RidA family protein n=1 Tax=Rhodococcus sp. IEGM 1307 TaxID=3047091 RepID=UPI0010623FCF|nr:RidA family protein [Rhodococcus sp. IEGM 1307]MDI9979536.1 RidA family protein [Rhodococcus sp. IEGM 1307]
MITSNARHEINAPHLPPPRGHFPHAVRIDGPAPLVHVSGLLALDADGRIEGPGDAEIQTSRILDSLETILAAAGADIDGLVKLTIYVTNIEDRAAVSTIRRSRWPDIKPASTLVEVSRLAADGAVVEIDAVAVVLTDNSRTAS